MTFDIFHGNVYFINKKSVVYVKQLLIILRRGAFSSFHTCHSFWDRLNQFLDLFFLTLVKEFPLGLASSQLYVLWFEFFCLRAPKYGHALLSKSFKSCMCDMEHRPLQRDYCSCLISFNKVAEVLFQEFCCILHLLDTFL